MNTIWADRDGVHDALSTEAEAMAWVRAIGPRLAPEHTAPGRQWSDDQRPGDIGKTAGELRVLRDALRRLAAESTRDPRQGWTSPVSRNAAVDAINQACATAPTWSELRWAEDSEPDRCLRSAEPPWGAAVSLLAERAVEMFTSDTRSQLRACLAPGCVLYFVRAHSRREWCSAGCGNRARVARHYQRHHPDNALA
ncbi:MAG: hypothetical protein EOP32_22840 [Rhodococcus sp. (in: high G+C Gram-positive bacteria)]|nr:MAG: hypothetical protein EOP32_22840 [Rhodococcus sp. (in: high G+C Gram-positive bacteria)]